MVNYIIRRLLLVIPTLLGITLVVFLVMALAPGGVGASLLSQEGAMRPEQRAALRRYYNKRYGLDRPILVQYGHWLNHVAPLGFAIYEDDQPRMVPDAAGHPAQVYVPVDGSKWTMPQERAKPNRPELILPREA